MSLRENLFQTLQVSYSLNHPYFTICETKQELSPYAYQDFEGNYQTDFIQPPPQRFQVKTMNIGTRHYKQSMSREQLHHLERMLILQNSICQVQKKFFSTGVTSPFGKLKEALATSQIQNRVSTHLNQRNEMLKFIEDIKSVQDLSNFISDYQSRLLRINDRENNMFMIALIQHVNSDAFLKGIETSQQKLDALDSILQNAELFERGSLQYHVPIYISDQSFANQQNILTDDDLLRIIALEVKLKDPQLSQSNMIESVYRLINNRINNKEIDIKLREQTKHKYLKIIGSNTVKKGALMKILRSASNAEMEANLEKYLVIMIQTGKSRNLEQETIDNILNKAEKDVEPYLNTINYLLHLEKVKGNMRIYNILNTNFNELIGQNLSLDQLLSLAVSLIELTFQEKTELKKRIDIVSKLIIQKLDNLGQEQDIEEIVHNLQVHLQIIANQISNYHQVTEDQERLYSQLFIALYRLCRNNLMFTYLKIKLFTQNFDYHLSSLNEINQKVLIISNKNEFLQICDVYAQEIFTNQNQQFLGMKSFCHLLQHNHIKSGLMDGVTHLLQQVVLNPEMKALFFQKHDLFVNSLMKNFKGRAEYFQMKDLIQMDMCLYDLYKVYRPQFFIQMLIDKINSPDNFLSQNEKIDLLLHLINYGLEFQSKKGLQQQKLVQLVDQHYKQLNFSQKLSVKDLQNLTQIRSFLFENKSLQIDQNVINDYNNLKKEVFVNGNQKCLLPFILASDSFQLELEQEEIEQLKTLLQIKFKSIDDLVKNQQEAKKDWKEQNIQNLTMEYLKEKTLFNYLTNHMTYQLKLKVHMESFQSSQWDVIQKKDDLQSLKDKEEIKQREKIMEQVRGNHIRL
eukprot:403336744